MTKDPAPVQEDYYSHPRPEVVALVPRWARNVVDVGCGAGGLGRELKRQRPDVKVRGVEVVPSQAERAKGVLDDAVCAGAEEPMPSHWPRPDCVIFADVLEHLLNPWQVLQAWRERLAPGGSVVVSLPNVAHWSILRGMLKGRWDYEDEGLLDRTHIRFFTQETAREMIVGAGFRLVHFERAINFGRIPIRILRGVARLCFQGRYFTASPLRFLNAVPDALARQFLMVGEAVRDASAEEDPFGVSVVVVNWNSKDDLETCLQSLRRQTDDHFEVVVVDNGSTDGSIALVREKFPEARLVETGENLGFAEGCNRGIEFCRRPWIALLNNDAEADPRWIEELRAAARAGGPGLGMIQSRIMFKHARDRTNSTGVLLKAGARFRDRDYDQVWRRGDATEEVFCVSAGAALYRRSMLDQVRLSTGYLDRNFFMYYEDVDLGWRCRIAGWSAVHAPRSVVYHAYHGSSSRHGGNFINVQCRRNRAVTVIKNASPWFLLSTLPWTVYDFFWMVWKAGPRQALKYVRALGQGAGQRLRISRLVTVRRSALERHWTLKAKEPAA